jgi:hypothetical protein
MMSALLTKKACEVAIEFDITEGRLSVLRNSPLWKEEERLMVEELQKETRMKIIGNTNDAVGVLVEVMNDGEESGATKVSASKALLSIGGFPSGVVITTSTEDTSYEGVTESLEQIQLAKKAILEAAGMSESELFADIENAES